MGRNTCFSCGIPVGSFVESLFHCDPNEPIDDIADGDTIVRGED